MMHVESLAALLGDTAAVALKFYTQARVEDMAAARTATESAPVLRLAV